MTSDFDSDEDRRSAGLDKNYPKDRCDDNDKDDEIDDGSDDKERKYYLEPLIQEFIKEIKKKMRLLSAPKGNGSSESNEEAFSLRTDFLKEADRCQKKIAEHHVGLMKENHPNLENYKYMAIYWIGPKHKILGTFITFIKKKNTGLYGNF